MASLKSQLDTSAETNEGLTTNIEQLNEVIATKEADLLGAAEEQAYLLDQLQDLQNQLVQHEQSIEELTDEKQTLETQLRNTQKTSGRGKTRL